MSTAKQRAAAVLDTTRALLRASVELCASAPAVVASRLQGRLHPAEEAVLRAAIDYGEALAEHLEPKKS